jgi:hypothetical protein
LVLFPLALVPSSAITIGSPMNKFGCCQSAAN